MAKSFERFGVKDGDSSSGSGWLVTFADLLSLVLTFFVLLYSMSSLDDSEWRSVSSSIRQYLNPADEENVVGPSAELTVSRVFVKKASNIDYLWSVFQEQILSIDILAKALAVQKLPNRVVISTTIDIFDEDTVTLSPQGEEIMEELTNLLVTIGNDIDIYSSAAREPSDKSESSEWTLSVLRAMRVSEALRKYGYSYNMDVFGRGDANVLSAEQAKAVYGKRVSRRVDIVVSDAVAP